MTSTPTTSLGSALNSAISSVRTATRPEASESSGKRSAAASRTALYVHPVPLFQGHHEASLLVSLYWALSLSLQIAASAWRPKEESRNRLPWSTSASMAASTSTGTATAGAAYASRRIVGVWDEHTRSVWVLPSSEQGGERNDSPEEVDGGRLAPLNPHSDDWMAALWYRGFWGKGSLSRSEPTWWQREKNRVTGVHGELAASTPPSRRKAPFSLTPSPLAYNMHAVATAEEVTSARRAERKVYKEQKAKERADEKEKQAAALASSAAEKSTPTSEGAQLPDASLVEAAEATVSSAEALANPVRADAIATVQQDTQEALSSSAAQTGTTLQKPRVKKEPAAARQAKLLAELEASSDATAGRVENLEHTQLQREEAFFLIFCLDSLSVVRQSSTESRKAMESSLTLSDVWKLFTAPRISPIVASPAGSLVRPDNAFIVSYVAYHHYRSLGWVVRNGIKFCSDWVLYKGSDGTQNMRGGAGPVGGHAE